MTYDIGHSGLFIRLWGEDRATAPCSMSHISSASHP